MNEKRFKTIGGRFAGAFRCLPVAAAFCVSMPGAALSQENPGDEQSEIAALKAEIEQLKGQLPSQSHTMADVEYHFTNLWFAGKSGDWPLAMFYLNETRSHLNWTVRVRPVRRTSYGEVDLRPILKGMEESSLAEIKAAIDAEDPAAFETAYHGMLTQCYACHQAAEKPYLKPHVPDAPASHLIVE